MGRTVSGVVRGDADLLLTLLLLLLHMIRIATSACTNVHILDVDPTINTANVLELYDTINTINCILALIQCFCAPFLHPA